MMISVPNYLKFCLIFYVGQNNWIPGVLYKYFTTIVLFETTNILQKIIEKK